MDSVTHIVLGAAIGESLLGKKIGRKAALVGAFVKTFPDFDLFYTGLRDAKMYMCHHRGHTHSLFWETLYAFPLAFIFYLLFKRKVSYQQWMILCLACLWGHSLLDTCTNYGTRLALPFTNTAFSWNTMSIVDLFFTFPMLLMVVIGLIAKNSSRLRRVMIHGALIYTVAYLGLTLVNKSKANTIVQHSLKTQAISFDHYFTNPTILNNILWYGMAANDSVLSVGEFTLMHPEKPIRWLQFPRQTYLMDQHPDTEDIKLLKWFSNGYSIARQDGDTLNVFCVKFGRTNMLETELEKTMVFHYKLFYAEGKWQMGMEEPNNENANMKEGFLDLVDRIQGINH